MRMRVKQGVVFSAVIAAAYALAGRERRAEASMPPFIASYATSCAVVEANTLVGFVTSLGPDAYQVSGEVEFVFVPGGAVARPRIAAYGSGLVAPGTTVRVATARLAFQLSPGEECRLDVRGAIRKQ